MVSVEEGVAKCSNGSGSAWGLCRVRVVSCVIVAQLHVARRARRVTSARVCRALRGSM